MSLLLLFRLNLDEPPDPYADLAIWPIGLPQQPSGDNYQELPGDHALRSPMDVGPPKARRRSTAEIDKIRCQFDLTTSESSTLDTFYEVTLGGGVLTYRWTHPRKLVLRTFRLASRPTYDYAGPDWWIARCELEVLP